MKILKWLLGLLISFYIFIAIFLIACLLCYNDYKITEFGDYSLLIVEDDSLLPTFKDGDLAVVRKNKYDEVRVGDYGFFYDTYEGQMSVMLGEITNKKTVTATEFTYVVNGEYDISSQYFIGLANTSLIYNGFGKVLGILESRFGFLLVIIFPILVAFIYEIYAIIREIRNPHED